MEQVINQEQQVAGSTPAPAPAPEPSSGGAEGAQAAPLEGAGAGDSAGSQAAAPFSVDSLPKNAAGEVDIHALSDEDFDKYQEFLETGVVKEAESSTEEKPAGGDESTKVESADDIDSLLNFDDAFGDDSEISLFGADLVKQEQLELWKERAFRNGEVPPEYKGDPVMFGQPEEVAERFHQFMFEPAPSTLGKNEAWDRLTGSLNYEGKPMSRYEAVSDTVARDIYAFTQQHLLKAVNDALEGAEDVMEPESLMEILNNFAATVSREMGSYAANIARANSAEAFSVSHARSREMQSAKTVVGRFQQAFTAKTAAIDKMLTESGGSPLDKGVKEALWNSISNQVQTGKSDPKDIFKATFLPWDEALRLGQQKGHQDAVTKRTAARQLNMGSGKSRTDAPRSAPTVPPGGFAAMTEEQLEAFIVAKGGKL